MDFLRKHKTLLIFSLSILILLILRIPSFFEPHWYDDEGIYSGVANQMSYGAELYSGGWDNKPPFMYLLFLGLSKIGNTLVLSRILSFVFAVATLFVVFKILQKLSVGKAKYLILIAGALLLGLPQFENNIANAENFFMLFTTIGIFFALEKRFLWTALFYSIAITVKAQPFFEFVALMPLILILMIHEKEKVKSILSKLFSLNLIFVFPTILISLIFFLFGSFREYLDSALLSNFKYVEEHSEVTMLLGMENSVALRLLIFALAILIISLLYWKRKLSFSTTLIFLWLAGSVFGAALSSRGYPHYLLQIIPALLVSVGILFSGKFLSLKNLLMTVVVGISLYGFLGFFFQWNKFEEHLPYYNYYQKGYGYLLGNVGREEWANFFNPKMTQFYETVEYIDEKTASGTVVYSVDQTGWFYELSNTKSASRYVAYYHIWHTENRTEMAFKEIEMNEPEYIVFNRKETWIFPDLWKYIQENYEKDAFENEWYEVFVRKA